MTPDAALAYDRAQRRLSAAAERSLARLWARVGAADDFGAAWDVAEALRLVTAAQLAAARGAEGYLSAVLPEVGLPDDPVGRVDPGGFAGVASDGRDLGSLLEEPVIRARAAGGGAGGLQAGGAQLRMIVSTQVADAAREAVQAGIVARPRVAGWVRMVTPPCCSRCAILAGRWYRWSDGFHRHPHCDCRHIPAPEDAAGDVRTDPRLLFERGQVRGLSQAQARAIADGADPGQVVNASRGMSTTEIGGRRVQVTGEGTTRRGYAAAVRRRVDEARGQQTQWAGQQVGRRGAVAGYVVRRTRAPRLMPQEIYRVASSREDAIRLLTVNGYLVPARGQSIRDLARTVA